MGGLGSGRQFGRPTVEASLVIDLAWMFRTERIKLGDNTTGELIWTRHGQPIMQSNYTATMMTEGSEQLVLMYAGGAVRQTIRLRHTVPNFGGKRWWMVCPFRGTLVNNVYLPPGGERFASRQFHRLAYRSERATSKARALDRLFALQNKLGCARGVGLAPKRPKGMWQRTFAAHLSRYQELEADVLAECAALTDDLYR